MKRIFVCSAMFVLFIHNGFAQFRYEIDGGHQRISQSTPLTVKYVNGHDAGNGKSVILAAALSLMFPGMGELYAGSFDRGKYHLATDGVLWLGYYGMTSYSDWLMDDARGFAIQHAGAIMYGKDKKFEVNIGNFINTHEYNEAKLRNREFNMIYTGSEFQWDWGSDDNRAKFKSLRIRSDEYFENAKFIIGALVVNRLISAFSAGSAAAKRNQDNQQNQGWSINSFVRYGGIGGQQIIMSFSKSF